MRRHLFFDDYSEGAHPAIIDAVRGGNDGQELGYGADNESATAADRIRRELGRDAAVHFVSGGTQANLVCLASVLRPHQGVIAATTAHINVHETGAVEATGHKIIAVPSDDGKLTPALIDEALATHQDEHSVLPRVVFISQATEAGTVYSRDELRAVIHHAKSSGLIAYVDGARLAMALAALDPPGTLSDIAACGAAMLYLGGTKNGGLAGEAVVILDENLRGDFRYHLKQRGALLAKGRLLGSQFARFFDDDGLWYSLGAKANASAARLAAGLIAAGCELMQPCQINQVFAIVPRPVIAALEQEYGFHVWKSWDDNRSVIRLVCSWATPDEEVDRFIAKVEELR